MALLIDGTKVTYRAVRGFEGTIPGAYRVFVGTRCLGVVERRRIDGRYYAHREGEPGYIPGTFRTRSGAVLALHFGD